jgi:hypothetical protein
VDGAVSEQDRRERARGDGVRADSERVEEARQHVELALTSYRDDERLWYVLEQARGPEGAER